MDAVLKPALLLFVMLNPFLLSIYLRDLFEDLDRKVFNRVMVRASIIAGAVFLLFAGVGDRIFSDLMGVRFAAFQIFGGVVFGIIGLGYVFRGPETLRQLRGKPEHLAGSVAMPVLIGPGTVSASVVVGTRGSMVQAAVAIVVTLAAAVVAIVLLKALFDALKQSQEGLAERYMDVVGRLSALVIGTIAVEMILQGLDSWLGR
jgi:small neutral amino acid transporter SnatA (MarC family)